MFNRYIRRKCFVAALIHRLIFWRNKYTHHNRGISRIGYLYSGRM